MKYIKDQENLNEKRVLLRLDLNVPLKNKTITDQTRIDKILPVINFLIKKRSKILVISHVGRPKGSINEDLSLEPICKNLEKKINLAFQNFSKKNNVLEITQEKLVSIDFNHNPASSIVDTTLTNVVGNNMGKISAWYDNEWGFSNRMCDIAQYLHKIS